MENVWHGSPLGVTPLGWLLIAVAVIAAHAVYFVMLPVLLTRHKTRSPGLRRYLGWVVATPSLLGDFLRVDARLGLMRLALTEGRYEQVAAQGFAVLRHPLPPTTLASARWRLADALEGLGRLDEAEDQRRQAELTLKAEPREPAWYLTRGRLFDTRGDRAAACRMYEAGLEVTPPEAEETRDLLAAHLANSLFALGRMPEAARRAEEAAALARRPERRLSAHRLAAAAYSECTRLDEAEHHKRCAAELAGELGDPKAKAEALAGLAEIQRKRGRLDEALAACDRAAGLARPTRYIESVRFEILRSWGRYDEALEALERSSQLDPLGIPRHEEKMQALKMYGRASVLMLQDRLDEVPDLLATARELLRGDAKLTLWCDAAEVRLAAALGRLDEAAAAFEPIEGGLRPFAQDLNTQAAVLGSLGRAALALGDYERALRYWEHYRDLPPKPVDLPTAHYHLGECLRALGDESAARDCYRLAADSGIDTPFARLAQSRLRSVLG